jgi:precorrin-8X/cobalt-precorrin-8 methylmutase
VAEIEQSQYIENPETIALQSFTQIRRELAAANYHFEPPIADVVERIIHSTADFDFAENTRLSSGAVEAGVGALQRGCPILCDVNMVRVGINRSRVERLGGSIHCFVAEPETRLRARDAHSTRSAMGIRLAAERNLLNESIVAVGNAPTALYETIRLVSQGFRPALIIGVPVGFVSTAESKDSLTELSVVPWITTLGRKGGSPVAVAVVNALLRLAADAPATEVD